MGFFFLYPSCKRLHWFSGHYAAGGTMPLDG